MQIPIELDHICVVLVSTRNPLNIGAVARAMCNFGFQRLRVVNPYDAAFREARSAVGATALLANAEEFQSIADAIADCTLVVGTTAIGHRQLQHPIKTLAVGVPFILEEVRGTQKEMRRVAILFGSEKVGLSNEDLSHCHWLMHIPTGEEQPSMNLGQAVAICLYELVRCKPDSLPTELPLPASAGEMERVTTMLLDVLRVGGYMDADSSDEKEQAMRRMVRRLNLSTEDSALWLGMLRQIAWKLKTKN